jgi:hypothetical protein
MSKKIQVHVAQVKNVRTGLELIYQPHPALNSEFLNGNPLNIIVLITEQDFSLHFLRWVPVLMIVTQLGMRLTSDLVQLQEFLPIFCSLLQSKPYYEEIFIYNFFEV